MHRERREVAAAERAFDYALSQAERKNEAIFGVVHSGKDGLSVDGLSDVANMYRQMIADKCETPEWSTKDIPVEMSEAEREGYRQQGRYVTHRRLDAYALDVERTWELITGIGIRGVGVVDVIDSMIPCRYDFSTVRTDHLLGSKLTAGSTGPTFPTLASPNGSYYPGFRRIGQSYYHGGKAGKWLCDDGMLGVVGDSSALALLQMDMDKPVDVVRTASIMIYIPRGECLEGVPTKCSTFHIKVEMITDCVDTTKPVEGCAIDHTNLPSLSLKLSVFDLVDKAGFIRYRFDTAPTCFCPDGLVATPDGTKRIQDIRKGDMVNTAASPQTVYDVVSTHAMEHTVYTINNTLRVTHKHPIKYEDRWVHPRSVTSATSASYTGDLINLVIAAPPSDVDKHTVIVDGVTCATLGCMIPDVIALDDAMDAKYGQGFWDAHADAMDALSVKSM